MRTGKNILKKLWQDESAQGMAEYVLLIVIVLAVFAMFKGKIVKAISDKTDSVSSGIDQAQ